MADAFVSAGYARLAYKACATFNSTEAGNIGPAADYLADLQALRPVLMSAGFPRYGTTVHQGYLFYRGRLVSESIKRFDPLTPMSDPDLVRFLSLQTPHRIGLIAHATLRRGVPAAREAADALTAEGHGHIFFDTTDDGDVEITAQLAAARPCVVAASDPLIIAYAIRLAEGAAAAPVPPPRHAAGPSAVIAGTVGPVILQQLSTFGAVYPVLTLDLLDPDGEEATIAAALDWADPLDRHTSVRDLDRHRSGGRGADPGSTRADRRRPPGGASARVHRRGTARSRRGPLRRRRRGDFGCGHLRLGDHVGAGLSGGPARHRVLRRGRPPPALALPQAGKAGFRRHPAAGPGGDDTPDRSGQSSRRRRAGSC